MQEYTRVVNVFASGGYNSYPGSDKDHSRRQELGGCRCTQWIRMRCSTKHSARGTGQTALMRRKKNLSNFSRSPTPDKA